MGNTGASSGCTAARMASIEAMTGSTAGSSANIGASLACTADSLECTKKWNS